MKSIADAALGAGCGVTILAGDEAEAEAFRALIRGRKGAGNVDVRVGRPEEMRPLSERFGHD